MTPDDKSGPPIGPELAAQPKQEAAWIHDFDQDTRICKRCNDPQGYEHLECFAANVTGLSYRMVKRQREGKIIVETFPPTENA